jgi:4-amino-4-deoxy-L-arabinose transferase-like glycosyltransferase
MTASGRKWQYALLLLLILAGCALRVATLPHEALDGDEMFSHRVALAPAGVAVSMIRNDIVHPPLYYFMIKAGVAVWGSSALGLRLLSLLFGLATIPLVAKIGSILPESRYTGMLAAALTALNGTLIFYSQQARSYAFYTFMVLLLVLWVWAVTSKPRSMLWWLAGSALMVVLVYTHYVGAVYIFFAVVAVLLSRQPRGVKIGTLLCGVVAAVAIVPWLLAVRGALQAKHGIALNLDWQGRPGLYDLKEMFAFTIGVLNFKGATTLALLVMAVLCVAAVVLVWGRQSWRDSPVLLTVVLLGFLPPLTMFVLSNPPFNQPLFATRHVLPSLPLLGILCCYGIELLLQRPSAVYRGVGAAAALMMVAIVSVDVVTDLRSGPARIPYDVVAKTLETEPLAGTPAYAPWFYGIGQTVNFYCDRICVQPMPVKDSDLPQTITLLYRPRATKDSRRYRALLLEGFVETSSAHYDAHSGTHGTTVAVLTRTRPVNAAH